MKRGLFLEIDNYSYGTVLYDILSGVDISGHKWVVDCLDLLYGSLKEKAYNAEEFRQEINRHNVFIFARIRGYPIGAKIDKPIESYEDYMESTCDLLLLCVDGGFFEVYIKEARYRERLYASCKKAKRFTVKWITDKNDGRTGFTIP